MPIFRSVTIITVLLLCWNLAGAAAFIMQYRIDPVQLAHSDPDMARAFATMPGWVWGVYALAVGAGTAGAIALIARKPAVASGLFLVSLVAVLVQFSYTLGATDLIARKGIVTAAGFPAFIIAVAVAQWLYARSRRMKGAPTRN